MWVLNKVTADGLVQLLDSTAQNGGRFMISSTNAPNLTTAAKLKIFPTNVIFYTEQLWETRILG